MSEKTLTAEEYLQRLNHRCNGAVGQAVETIDETFNELAQMVVVLNQRNQKLAEKAHSTARENAALVALKRAVMQANRSGWGFPPSIIDALEDVPSWDDKDLMRDLQWALDELGSLGVHRERLQIIADRFRIPVMMAVNPDLELTGNSANAPIPDGPVKAGALVDEHLQYQHSEDCDFCRESVGYMAAKTEAAEDVEPPLGACVELGELLKALAEADVESDEVGIEARERGDGGVELILHVYPGRRPDVETGGKPL